MIVIKGDRLCRFKKAEEGRRGKQGDEKAIDNSKLLRVGRLKFLRKLNGKQQFKRIRAL